MSISAERIVGSDLIDVFKKVEAGQRLDSDDGLLLYQHPNLTGVAYMANVVRERKNGDKAYYVRNQHINYTNICNKFCKFCSFYAKKGGPDPYEMTIDEVRTRLEWHKDVRITEVHMVGGINPRLSYQYYMDLVAVVKEVLPGAHVKAFTAIEIEQIAKKGKVSIDQALKDLMKAGLDWLPGGGIEILSDRVHQALFGRKLSGEEWKAVARATAKVGLPQYATMLYGHIETDAERVEHLVQLRELQDEVGNFLSFTPLSFHPENTELEDVQPLTGDMDLRNIAVSRLMLDNFDRIKSFWIMNTAEITQASLWYGADDCDGLVHEYEITYNEGDFGNKSQGLTYQNMNFMIREAGRVPVERDSLYNVVERSPEELADTKPTKQLAPLTMVH